ncbi:hypothetical protein CYMTET_27521, partial [Cymbomonas tetramitiformis]
MDEDEIFAKKVKEGFARQEAMIFPGHARSTSLQVTHSTPVSKTTPGSTSYSTNVPAAVSNALMNGQGGMSPALLPRETKSLSSQEFAQAWSAVGKPKVLGADRSPADPATAAGVALQRYAREQERTPVNSSLASQNVRPSTGRSPHGYAPHAGAIVPAESREPPSVPSRQHISEIKELIQEEESIALLKEQVQQMKMIKIDSDRKDSIIGRLQEEMLLVDNIKKENTELKAKLNVLSDKDKAQKDQIKDMQQQKREIELQLQKYESMEETTRTTLSQAETAKESARRSQEEVMQLSAQTVALRRDASRQDEIRLQLEQQLLNGSEAAAQSTAREGQLMTLVRTLKAEVERCESNAQEQLQQVEQAAKKQEREATIRGEALNRARTEVTTLHRQMVQREEEIKVIKERMQAAESLAQAMRKEVNDKEMMLNARAVAVEEETTMAAENAIEVARLQQQLHEMTNLNDANIAEIESLRKMVDTTRDEAEQRRSEMTRRATDLHQQSLEMERQLISTEESSKRASANMGHEVVMRGARLSNLLDGFLARVPVEYQTVIHREPATGEGSESTMLVASMEDSEQESVLPEDGARVLSTVLTKTEVVGRVLSNLMEQAMDNGSSRFEVEARWNEDQRKWEEERGEMRGEIEGLHKNETELRSALSSLEVQLEEATERLKTLEADWNSAQKLMSGACEELMMASEESIDKDDELDMPE